MKCKRLEIIAPSYIIRVELGYKSILDKNLWGSVGYNIFLLLLSLSMIYIYDKVFAS